MKQLYRKSENREWELGLIQEYLRFFRSKFQKLSFSKLNIKSFKGAQEFYIKNLSNSSTLLITSFNYLKTLDLPL